MSVADTNKIKGVDTVRITIDTELNAIIVPNKFYEEIDKLNKVVAERGGEKIDYTQYVRDEFAKAIDSPMKRLADVTTPRKKKAADKDTSK